ncbi:MAG: hypothetical protein ACFFHD_15255 [Promethearchaeota archaeon]
MSDYKILHLPNGWKKVLCPFNFCKVCRGAIAYWGICSPSQKHYYHTDCVSKSKTFQKALKNLK